MWLPFRLFTTIYDRTIPFKGLQTSDPAWYTMLTSKLTTEHTKALQEIIVTAEQKKHLRRSKEIEKSGGTSLLSKYFFINLTFYFVLRIPIQSTKCTNILQLWLVIIHIICIGHSPNEYILLFYRIILNNNLLVYLISYKVITCLIEKWKEKINKNKFCQKKKLLFK